MEIEVQSNMRIYIPIADFEEPQAAQAATTFQKQSFKVEVSQEEIGRGAGMTATVVTFLLENYQTLAPYGLFALPYVAKVSQDYLEGVKILLKPFQSIYKLMQNQPAGLIASEELLAHLLIAVLLQEHEHQQLREVTISNFFRNEGSSGSRPVGNLDFTSGETSFEQPSTDLITILDSVYDVQLVSALAYTQNYSKIFVAIDRSGKLVINKSFD